MHIYVSAYILLATGGVQVSVSPTECNGVLFKIYTYLLFGALLPRVVFAPGSLWRAPRCRRVVRGVGLGGFAYRLWEESAHSRLKSPLGRPQ